MNILKGKIHNQIILAMALGIAAGIIFGPACENLRIIGDTFIRLLKMIIVPLVMASMATGVASIGNIRKLGSIGGKTFVYYMLTTILAVTVGLLLVNIIGPGVGIGVTLAASEFDPETAAGASIGSLFTDIVPNNPIAAMAEGNMLSIIFFSLLLGAAIGAA
ncbi:MAG: cation:dicarboxylase symporter family transporter, partial [Planctomycetes bacterium]|nr:cation:dicarboxylase symporter family transporter [Planctomycetota bacterium]